MQILVKVENGLLAEAPALVKHGVRRALAADHDSGVQVAQVFPGLTEGRRAGLFSVELPPGLSKTEVDRVLQDLREVEGVEFANIPAARHPM